MQKYLVQSRVFVYPSGMDTTAAPATLKPEFAAIALNTETKTTEKFEDRFFAKENFTVKFCHDQKDVEFKAGKEITGFPAKAAFEIYDVDGRTVAARIPWEKVEIKTFVTVREYKTTVWEVKK